MTFNYVILLPERFSLYDRESLKGARRRKNAACVVYNARARLAHAHMNMSSESNFDSVESNNLQFFILACVVRL